MNSYVFWMNVIVPIAVCVILPVVIVWIISRVRRNETDRRAEIMLKALETGAPIDPEMFKKPVKQPKNIKQELLDRLTGACITGFMGIAFLAVGVLYLLNPDWRAFVSPSLMLIAGGVMLAVGIALLIGYFTGRKMFAKELEDK